MNAPIKPEDFNPDHIPSDQERDEREARGEPILTPKEEQEMLDCRVEVTDEAREMAEWEGNIRG